MNLRIGINALFMLPGEVGGREIDTRRLIEDLAASDRVASVVVFANRENETVLQADRSAAGNAAGKIEIIPTGLRARRRPARILFEQLRLPALARRARVDVLHSPGYVAPLSCGARSAVTICDLNYRSHPQDFSRLSVKVMGTLVPASARRSAVVCTLTEYWRGEIIRTFRLPPEKVFVTPCAVDPAFTASISPNQIARVRQKHNLPESFILCPSASHPHKNLERFLEAFARARRAAGWRHGLVITGSPGRARTQIEDTIRRLDLAGHVRLLGWIDGADIPLLYAAARCMAFPTLYEGFGRPVIEAFAAGLPAAVSGIPVLREVAGGAVLFFDPQNIESMSGALNRITADDELRARLIEAGAERARHFSLKIVVESHLTAFQFVMIHGE